MARRLSNFNQTDSGTTSAQATEAAAAGRRHVVTHISGYTDTDSLLQILSESTIIWEARIEQDLTGQGFSITIPDGVMGERGESVSGKVVTGTTACRVNISGYSKVD